MKKYVKKAVCELYPGLKNKVDFDLIYDFSSKDFSLVCDFSLNDKKFNVVCGLLWDKYGNFDEFMGGIQFVVEDQKMIRKHNFGKYTDKIGKYNDFLLKNCDRTKVIYQDPFLLKSFKRVNKKYFNGKMKVVNLYPIILKEPMSEFGLYTDYNNSVYLYKDLAKVSPKLLDYIMYHELLHKKMGPEIGIVKGFPKVSSKFDRFKCFWHYPKFKQEEKKFENFKLYESLFYNLCNNKSFRKRNNINW
jgi:hypothetical protein